MHGRGSGGSFTDSASTNLGGLAGPLWNGVLRWGLGGRGLGTVGERAGGVEGLRALGP